MKRMYYYSLSRMKPVKSCLACLLFLFCMWGVFGQETEAMRLSPQDAVDMAVRSNLSLESARISLDTKERKADYVWNQFLPTVSVSGTLARSNRDQSQPAMNMTLPPLLGGGEIEISPPRTVPRWSMMGSLTMSLNFSFAMIEGIKSIKLDYQTGLISLDRARLQMERDIRKSYNSILLLEENAALLRGSFANAERQAATAEANYRAGLAPRLTLLQAQVAVENMKPSINEMENSLNALKGSFAMNLGLPYDTPFMLEPFSVGTFDVPLDLAELISGAVARKPDLMELRQSIAALQSARKAQALQLYTPFLNFNWGVNAAFLRDPWKDSWFEADNWNNSGQFSITLGYSLNSLFPFTQQGQALKDMDNNIRIMNINLAQAVMGTELEIFTKLNSLEKTLSTEEAQRGAVELAELSFNLTEEAYRAGLQDFQAVQNAALALDQARVQLLTQQFNYLNDLIDLEYAVGVPFGTLSNNGGAR